MNPFNILGIDPSLTSTGLSVISSEDTPIYRATIKTKLLRDEERLKFIKDEITSVIKKFNIKKVMIESYAYNVRQSKRKFQLGELGGVIRLTLYELGVEFQNVAPPTLKKYATGHGNADKIMMVEAVLRRWNEDVGSAEDEADAFGLAKLGVEVYALGKNVPAIIKQMTKEKTSYVSLPETTKEEIDPSAKLKMEDFDEGESIEEQVMKKAKARKKK